MNETSQIRIGVIVPAGNVIHEREFTRLRPEGVRFHFTGFSYPAAGTTNFCDDMARQLAEPIGELKAWGAELILLGCTTASMSCADDAHCAQLAEMAGVPLITAAGASCDAMTALGARSVAVATPYGDANNLIVSNFLKAHGVEVAAIKGLGLDRSLKAWRERALNLTPQEVLDFSVSVDVDNAEAMYLPCTGIGSLEVLDMFERQACKPAFSSVQAGYWASLRRLGVDGRKKGYGRLVDVWDF